MADKHYRIGEVRQVEVRVVPNRGDVDFRDLVVTSPQFRILRYKKDSDQLEEVYGWANGSYDMDRGLISGSWDGTLARLSSFGHYAMELQAVVDTETIRHLVSIDVEI